MKILQERSTAYTWEPWFLAQAAPSEAPAGTALFCGSLPLSAGRTKGKSWGAAADQDQRDTGEVEEDGKSSLLYLRLDSSFWLTQVFRTECYVTTNGANQGSDPNWTQPGITPNTDLQEHRL